MRTSAGFHADPLNAPVCCEAQQLLASEAFTNHHLPALTQANYMKTRLT
jgi:hypothetical protein